MQYCISSRNLSFTIWYARLDHPSQTKILYILEIDVKGSIQNICEVCPLAKQQRSMFPKSKIPTNGMLELLHVDIWSPYSIKSIFGAKYILIIVDDFLRATWTFLLHDKTRVANALQEFITMSSVPKVHKKEGQIMDWNL